MTGQVTLVVIKPDAISRELAGAVYTRLESLGLEVVGLKAVQVSRELAAEHYKFLKEKAFFEELLDFLQGKMHNMNYVLVFILQGRDAIERVRKLSGATDPLKADPTSIRGSLGRNIMENLLHASSDSSEAEREIALWFKSGELLRPVQSADQKSNSAP